MGAAEHHLDNVLPVGFQIVQSLRRRVIRCELAPGAVLSTTAIANEYGVSRQPVSRAFVQLAEEGLLEVRPQRGTFVPLISGRNVVQAQFIREAIEADVVRRVAEFATPAQISGLESLVAAQRRAEEVDDFIRLDDQFHRNLAEIADRVPAWAAVETQKAHLDRLRHLSLHRFPQEAMALQHASVVAAIKVRDSGSAETAMRTHLRHILGDLPTIAAENPEFFQD